MARFGRVLTAMVTPFTDDGSLDVDGAVALARWLRGAGQRGPRARWHHRRGADAERRREADAVGGRRGGGDRAGPGRLDDQRHGPLGAPDGRGVEARRRRRARAVPVLQPSVAGRDRGAPAGRSPRPPICRSWSTTSRSAPGARSPRPCSPDWPTRCRTSSGSRTPPAARPRRPRLLAVAPAGYEVYSGDDALTLPLLAVGAVGLIGVATHWAAPEVVAMFDAWADRRHRRGPVELNARLLESWDVRDGRRRPEPGPGEGDAAPPRPAGRVLPPADGRRPGVARRTGRRGVANLVAARDRRVA